MVRSELKLLCFEALAFPLLYLQLLPYLRQGCITSLLIPSITSPLEHPSYSKTSFNQPSLSHYLTYIHLPISSSTSLSPSFPHNHQDLLNIWQPCPPSQSTTPPQQQPLSSSPPPAAPPSASACFSPFP